MFIGMNYINGRWGTYRPDFPSLNPATEEEIGRFPQSTPEEAESAIRVAKKAQKEWRKVSRVKRGEYFDKLCQIIKRDIPFFVKAINQETGKNENESLAEMNEVLHMVQYTFGKSRMPIGEIIPSEIAEKDSYIIRKPKGVVTVITPWNFPAAIFSWCAAPAILEGNTVVFKPSEDTPMVAQMAVAQYAEAGFPDGVINLLHGDGKVGSDLVYNKEVNHYCFTGSAKVGQFIRHVCALQMTKTCSLEMGSKSAVIVHEDADLDLAVKSCLASAYKLSGQRCVSAGRILVHARIWNDFVNMFVQESGKVELGPLINGAQKKRVLEYNQLVLNDPECTVHAYTEYGDIVKGYYVGPLVYSTVWQENESRRFLKEEVFGPHIALIPYQDIDEAIKIYNDTEYGLSCAVITNDYRIMRKVRDECEFGLGYVNGGTIAAESHNVFGGVKKSGYGGSSAAGTFDAVVHKVAWTVNHGDNIIFPQGLK